MTYLLSDALLYKNMHVTKNNDSAAWHSSPEHKRARLVAVGSTQGCTQYGYSANRFPPPRQPRFVPPDIDLDRPEYKMKLPENHQRYMSTLHPVYRDATQDVVGSKIGNIGAQMAKFCTRAVEHYKSLQDTSATSIDAPMQNAEDTSNQESSIENSNDNPLHPKRKLKPRGNMFRAASGKQASKTMTGASTPTKRSAEVQAALKRKGMSPVTSIKPSAFLYTDAERETGKVGFE